MAVDMTILDALHSKLLVRMPDLTTWNKYYAGEHPLAFMTSAVTELMGDRVAPVVCNLARLAVDELVNRIDVTGFRFAGEDTTSSELWDIWQANDLDTEFTCGITEACSLGSAFILTGPPVDSGGPAIMTLESPMNCAVTRDVRTRKIVQFAKFIVDEMGTEFRTLMLPDVTEHYVREKGKSWLLHSRDVHNLGEVTVKAITPNSSLRDRNGIPTCIDVYTLNDALNKWLTDLMIAGEYTTIQRRWATGIDKKDFQDNGRMRTVLKQQAQSIWSTENSEAKFGSFAVPDLKNFHDTIKLFMQIIAMQLGLPSHYISFDTVNAPGGQGIVSEEARFIKRVERVNKRIGGALEGAMRDSYLVQRRAVPQNMYRLETQFRDPATPTIAQTTDAVIKRFSVGLIDDEQALIDLNYSPETRARMRADAVVRRAQDIDAMNKPFTGDAGDDSDNF